MTGRAGGLVAVVALALALAGCGSDEPRAAAGRPAAADPSTPQSDGELLGREVFELVDRAADYKGSHRGRPAASFRQMGMDTLTPLTVRRIANPGGVPTVTVAFRRTAGRALHSCRGTPMVLEDAALNGGRFTVACTTADGTEQPIEIDGASR